MFKRITGMVLIGIVIKFMDEFLDKDLDKLKGEDNLYYLLQRSILPYSLVLMLIALYLNFNEATALFAASYALGMVYNFKSKLPTYLLGWQESVLILILSTYVTSFFNTISAFILIILLQIIDDFWDYHSDEKIGEKNFVIYLGSYPALLLGIILLLISLKWFPIKSLYFLIAVIFVYLIIFIIQVAYHQERNNINI